MEFTAMRAQRGPASLTVLLRYTGSKPVGARNPAALRDLYVFVDGSTESITSDDLGVGLGECA